MKRLRILITGGAGFIGSHLVDAYIKAKHKVVVVDNLSTGKKQNLNKKASFYNCDITNKKEIGLIISRENPDIISHHAAQTKISKSVENPQLDEDINIRGLLNILKSAKKIRTKRIIFASSGGAIYGDEQVLPTSEDARARPISPYGVSKRAGELYLDSYFKMFNLPYLSMRYANVYGPKQNQDSEGGVIAIFILKILKNESPTIHGDGSYTRDFIFIEDVVKANLKALETDYSGAVNIGSGIETSIFHIFKMIKRNIGSRLTPNYKSSIIGEQKNSALDTKFAENILGWKSLTNLEEGIAKTTNWYKTQLSA